MSTGSQTKGLNAWRQLWIPVLLEGLSSPDTHLRHRVSLYAVPVPLGLDQASVLLLLQQVLQPQPGQLAATDAQVGQYLVSHQIDAKRCSICTPNPVMLQYTFRGKEC